MNALLAVSPAVRNYHKVSQIIDKEVLLVREYQSAQRWFGAGGRFSGGELAFFGDLYARLLSASLVNLDEC